ncbi:MAG: RidA family protein, partial [Microcoleus sp. SIO2G3]|nr:RidA family protein [Microcoleus sp. SIO2G3]
MVTVEENNVKTIYLAGQVGVDQTKNFVGNGDLESQTIQSFKNISTALATVGAGIADITKITIYVVNY